MRFLPTPIAGALVIETEPRIDERGSFRRVFCEREFKQQRLPSRFEQHSISVSKLAGTIRGMHFSTGEHAETKLVRCIQGAIYDAIVDLRISSPTYLQTFAVELSSSNERALLVPVGCAHGFQTLVDDCSVLYQITPYYVADAADGVRYDDPSFSISWPLPVSCVNDKDQAWPLWASRIQPVFAQEAIQQ